MIGIVFIKHSKRWDFKNQQLMLKGRMGGMNIIWLGMEPLMPATSGGRIGSLKRLEQISKNNNIFLFYPYDNDNELNYVAELQQLCREVYPYSRKKNFLHALLNLYRYPFTIGSRFFHEMQKDIMECIKNNSIDLINVEYPHMCVDLFDLDIQLPIVLNQFNVEWKLYKGIAKSSPHILKKIAYGMDSIRLKHFERRISRKLRLSLVTFLSDKDMAFMIDHRFYLEKDCRQVPLGADVHLSDNAENVERVVEMFPMVQREKTEEQIILFSGKMSYGPNAEAAVWFVKEVFPNILKEIPSARFCIMGKDPTEEVRRLASDRVIVTGFVEDTEVYFKKAKLVVLPLLNGGGVKVKLLQAISYQKLIVSTSKGVEGIQYSDGKTIPVADNLLGCVLRYCIIRKMPKLNSIRHMKFS